MTTPNVQVRRATVEDLPKLVPLWQQENLPWEDLEKRFKEFQVAEGAGGELLGAVGLQIAGLEGCLHGEVFAHPEQADALRDKLWERVQILARNHGLVRVWTQIATPFWHQNGFHPAGPDLLPRRPAAFTGEAHPWLFLPLKEENAAAPVSLEKEFALFKEAEKERTQQIIRQARVLKMVATVIAIIVLILVAVLAIVFFRHQSRTRGRPPGAGLLPLRPAAGLAVTAPLPRLGLPR